MRQLGVEQRLTVTSCGAEAGAVLVGSSQNNRGLRLRVSQPQDRGTFGPVTGVFVILDAGDNKHSNALLSLIGRETNAAEVTAAIRRDHPGCVSVANRNLLSSEPLG